MSGITPSYDAFVKAAKGSYHQKGPVTVDTNNKLEASSMGKKVGRLVKFVAKPIKEDKVAAFNLFREALITKLSEKESDRTKLELMADSLLMPYNGDENGEDKLTSAAILKIDKLVKAGVKEPGLAAKFSVLARNDSFSKMLQDNHPTARQSASKALAKAKSRPVKTLASNTPVVSIGVKAYDTGRCIDKALTIGRLKNALDKREVNEDTKESKKLLTDMLKVAQNYYISLALQKGASTIVSGVNTATGLDASLIIDPGVEAAFKGLEEAVKSAPTEKIVGAAQSAVKSGIKSGVQMATDAGVKKAANKLADAVSEKSANSENINVGKHHNDNLGNFSTVRSLITYLAQTDRMEDKKQYYLAEQDVEPSEDRQKLTDESKFCVELLQPKEANRLGARKLLFPRSSFDSSEFVGTKATRSESDLKPLRSTEIAKTHPNDIDFLREMYAIFCKKSAEI